MRSRRREGGFTLIELLMTLFMGSLVVAAVTKFYVSQHYHLNQQMDVADVQQNLRSAMQEMTDQIRMAGYGMPNAMDPILASNTNPDTIMFFYRRTPTSQAELTQDMATPTDDLVCTGYDLSEFRPNTWSYVFDPSTNTGEFFYMSAVDDGADQIRHTISPLSKSYGSGSLVIAVEVLKYFVDLTDAANPRLMRSRQGEGTVVFSEGIDSLEFSYQLTTGAWSDAPVAGRLIRSVQITLGAVGRGDVDGVVQGARHRTLTTRVNVRNLAL
jgi:prepilin-type N-terminal cleavage/methylation domain-containing protein